MTSREGETRSELWQGRSDEQLIADAEGAIADVERDGHMDFDIYVEITCPLQDLLRRGGVVPESTLARLEAIGLPPTVHLFGDEPTAGVDGSALPDENERDEGLIRDALLLVSEAAGDRLAPIELAALLLVPQPALDGRTATEAIRAGDTDAVVAMVRHVVTPADQDAPGRRTPDG